jgi:magnesium transporter
MLLERVDFLKIGRTVARECAVGALTGACYGLVAGALGALLFGSASAPIWLFGLQIAAALAAVMTLSATLGGLIPFAFQRLAIDPNVATGTFVIAGVDVVGVWVFMWLATL